MMKIAKMKATLLLLLNVMTPEIVNFMATHGRGLICVPITEEGCEELGLELMVDGRILHSMKRRLLSPLI